MNRTQNRPKRRQEKQLSVCRKHWNHMQVTDRPSPDAPSLITGNSYGNVLLLSSVSTMQVNSDDLWTDIFNEIRWRYWSELFMKHSWRRWNLSGLSPRRKTKRVNNHDHTITFSSPSIYLTSQGASDDWNDQKDQFHFWCNRFRSKFEEIKEKLEFPEQTSFEVPMHVEHA